MVFRNTEVTCGGNKDTGKKQISLVQSPWGALTIGIDSVVKFEVFCARV